MNDEVSMMFQEGCIMKGHTAGQSILIDTDYEESNKSYNRVKNYSFERWFTQFNTSTASSKL